MTFPTISDWHIPTITDFQKEVNILEDLDGIKIYHEQIPRIDNLDASGYHLVKVQSVRGTRFYRNPGTGRECFASHRYNQ